MLKEFIIFENFWFVLFGIWIVRLVLFDEIFIIVLVNWCNGFSINCIVNNKIVKKIFVKMMVVNILLFFNVIILECVLLWLIIEIRF